ncbi:hypothetical protein ACWZEH_31395 [Streptomyces sp. QTS137]
MTEHARASAGAVAAALQDVAALGGFFVMRVGGRDEGRHPLDHSYAGGFTDPAEAVAHQPALALNEQVMGHLRGPADGLRVRIAPRLLDGRERRLRTRRGGPRPAGGPPRAA